MPRPPSIDSGVGLYWRIMRALHAHYGVFTCGAVTAIAGERHRNMIDRYLVFLRQEGIVAARTEKSKGREVYLYAIERDGESPPLRRAADSTEGLRQQALWTAMRALPAFSIAEIAMAATTGTLLVRPGTAKNYLRGLRVAGYVAACGNGLYRLLPQHNTGPRAPMVLASERAVFDVNLMRVVNVTPSETSGRAA